MKHMMETAETDQPWVIYTYGRSHDKWWPFWNSTRVMGYARIGIECIVCGTETVVTIKMPRFRAINKPAGYRHPKRLKFLIAHIHPDKPHPMAWARPLRNPAAHPGGLNLDLLAMRLEAELRDQS